MHPATRTRIRGSFSSASFPACRGDLPRIAVLSIALGLALLCGENAVASPPAPSTPSVEEASLFYPARFYVDRDSFDDADVLILQPGEVSPEVQLRVRQSGGRIRCQVRGAEDDAALSGVLVEARVGRHVAIALTGADGVALLTGVPGGSATIRTRPDDPRSETGAYAVRFAPGVEDRDQATVVAVAEGQTSDAGIVRIPRAGRIKATVLRPGGAAWSGARVVLRPVDDATGASAHRHATDADGRITFGGLEPGGYRLWVDARGNSALSEAWDGSRDTLNSGVLEVRRGDLLSGLLIRTEAGGTIRGTVRDTENLAGYPDMEVRLLPAAPPGAGYTFRTDDIGLYEAIGLPAGSYKIYVPEIRRYHPEARTLAEARSVLVAEGQVVSGIEVRGKKSGSCEMPPETAGAVMGIVRADFLLFPGATIQLWNDADTVRARVTEAGVYTVPCLRPGMYKAALLPEGAYRTQYHPKTNDLLLAQLITVAAGDTAERIDFEPERSIEIRGSVAAAEGEGDGFIAEMPVVAHRTDGALSLMQRTDGEGMFVFDRLPDGTGIPAGDWVVGTDSITIPLLTITPAVRVDLMFDAGPGGLTLRLAIPADVEAADWQVQRRRGDGPPSVLKRAADHPHGVWGRTFTVENPVPGDGYRLQVWIAEGMRQRRLDSDWIWPARAAPPRLSPNPWNGRGALTIGAPGVGIRVIELPELFGADGRRIGRLQRSGDGFCLPPAAVPQAGIYFLRYRTGDDGHRRERLVLTP